jgi:hypothetical protein
MTSRIWRVARVILLTTIVGYLGWQVYAGRSTLASLRLEWDMLGLAGALITAFVAYQCLVLAWVILLWRTGYYSAGHISQYLRVWWVSYLYRYVPGKVLLVVERARMGSAIGIPFAAGAALTIVETMLAILAGCAVSLLAVSYYAAADSRLLAVVVIFALGAVFLFPAGFRLLCELPFVRTRYPELRSVVLAPRDIIAAVVPYIFHYLLLGLSFFLISRSLNLFSWSDLPGLCGVYALSHVISLVALVAPGGLGVRESALAVQLGRFVPTGVAEVLAIGIRVWFTVVELVCYVGVLVFCPAPPEAEPAASKPDRFK